MNQRIERNRKELKRRLELWSLDTQRGKKNSNMFKDVVKLCEIEKQTQNLNLKRYYYENLKMNLYFFIMQPPSPLPDSAVYSRTITSSKFGLGSQPSK